MYRPCPHYVSLPPIKLFLFCFQWYVTRKYPIVLYDKVTISMKYLFNFKRLLWPCFRPEIHNNIVHYHSSTCRSWRLRHNMTILNFITQTSVWLFTYWYYYTASLKKLNYWGWAKKIFILTTFCKFSIS